MRELFRFGLYLDKQFSEPKTSELVWRKLSESLVGAERFDSVNDAKIQFSEEAFRLAGQIYDDEGVLFVKGKRNLFLAVFTRQTERLSTWDFYLPVNALSGAKKDLWLDWIFDLCGKIPVIFGFGCSELEFYTKHERVKNLPGGGRVTEWAGISFQELALYLPGFYWLTIFGKDLVNFFGEERLLNIPKIKAVTLDSGQIALLMKQPLMPDDMQNRFSDARSISEKIGENYFFNAEKPDFEYKQIPEIKRLFK